MADVNTTIKQCEKINGSPRSNNFTPTDRKLAIENAKETSFLRTAFDKFMAMQGLLHDGCDEERKGLWNAVEGIRKDVGVAGQQAAHNKGLIIGKGRSKKDLFMTITIIIAAVGIVVNVGLLIYFKQGG